MPDREPVLLEDVCDLAMRWQVGLETMQRVALSAEQYFQETRGRPLIISGYRTQAEQAALGRAGRPTALDALSTHRSCPATGVDISLGAFPTRVEKAIWGRIVVLNGLRWGGCSDLPDKPCPVDSGGIPVDWQHVDRGPRARAIGIRI